MRLSHLPKRFSRINRRIKWVAELTQTVFVVLLIVFVSLLLVEAVSEGSVSSRLNLRYLLIVVIVVGVITVLAAPSKIVGYFRQMVEFARAIPPVLKRFLAMIRYSSWVVALAQEVFVALLITFILLLLVETTWGKSVSPYLNLNYLLIAVIVVGVVAILTSRERVKVEEGRLARRDIVMVVCAGLAGAAIVWYKTKEIGWPSYVVSVISGGLIVLLSLLIGKGDERE